MIAERNLLNCRVTLSGNIFTVEICGTIHARAGCTNAAAKITISDITIGPDWVKPVCQVNSSNPFYHKTDLGRLPSEITTLQDWLLLAEIPAENLSFPRKGTRTLQFDIAVMDEKSRCEFNSCCAECIYENESWGYIELQEDIQKAKQIGCSLALAVAAAGKKITVSEIEIIKKWVSQTDPNEIYRKVRWAAFIDFLPFAGEIYCRKICQKISDSVPMKIRCQIIEICLRIAGTGNSITDMQLFLLKKIAYWLGINCETFRSMTESVLPIRMYEIDDLEISLGITGTMNNDQLCRQLSKEYRKWNARVTSRNPEIEFQAEQMLKLIANLRNQYTL